MGLSLPVKIKEGGHICNGEMSRTYKIQGEFQRTCRRWLKPVCPDLAGKARTHGDVGILPALLQTVACCYSCSHGEIDLSFFLSF